MKTRSVKRFLVNFAQVGIFSCAIAILVWWLTGIGSFTAILVVSLSIGWSISIAFLLLQDWLSRMLGPWLAPVPIVACGLGVGLMIAGVFQSNHPLIFFTQDFSALVIGLFFGITGSLIFSARERLRKTREQLAEAELRQSRQEKMLAETELKLLQAQIEPHFLFNTLSNITQLVRSDPKLAVGTLENLTTLLRASLARTRDGENTLGQEIDFAAAYLAIQATRMGNRLRYEIDLPDELREIPLPPLLIQPLLENAVIHGIETEPEGGEITFTARQINGELILGVSDTGAGISETGSTNGTGLRNIRDRLRLRYGSKASLELSPANPRGVNAIINIPL